jgi:hypothetical protein
MDDVDLYMVDRMPSYTIGAGHNALLSPGRRASAGNRLNEVCWFAAGMGTKNG